MLLAEILGDDLYDKTSLPQFRRMISILVEIQAGWIGREPEMLGLALPDWRLPQLEEKITDVIERTALELSPADIRTLRFMVESLPVVAAAIDACGLPPTLVHGDFHPGNVRGKDTALILLDWGDSGLGHPLLDEATLMRHVPEDQIQTVSDHWHAEWQRLIPGCNANRASTLIKPVAAARQAVIHRLFLDNAEPPEDRYVEGKSALWLRRAAQLWRDHDLGVHLDR
jgi:Ser/Thr protein kinase RdoA (MazF antagonist)